MNDRAAVTLTARGARKRDAGRGVARLSGEARRTLGVLSGDTVVIEGPGGNEAVAKVWPAGDIAGDAVRIDAERPTDRQRQFGSHVLTDRPPDTAGSEHT